MKQVGQWISFGVALIGVCLCSISTAAPPSFGLALGKPGTIIAVVDATGLERKTILSGVILEVRFLDPQGRTIGTTRYTYSDWTFPVFKAGQRYRLELPHQYTVASAVKGALTGEIGLGGKVDDPWATSCSAESTAYIGSGAFDMKSKPEMRLLLLGPSGGTGGTEFWDSGVSRLPRALRIRSGWFIDSIQMVYGSGQVGVRHGGGGGGLKVFPLDSGEYIKQIGGTYDKHVASLWVVTNLNRRCEWGDASRGKATFRYAAPPEYAIQQLWGRSSQLVDAIGVVLVEL